MIYKLIMLGVNHRLVSLLFLVIVTLGTSVGLFRLNVDTSFKGLIPQTDPDTPVYNRIVQEFGSDNRSIIYVRDTNLWTPEKLASLEKLHYALEELDFVERVDDLFSLHNIRGTGGKIDARLFLPEAPKDQLTADQALSEALNNPLVVGNFLSEDGSVTALLVSVQEDYNDEQFNIRVNETLEHLVTSFRSVFEEVFQVGPPRVQAEVKSILLKDLKLLGPISVFVLVTSIFFFLRCWFAALIPLATSALSISWTFGIMGLTGMPINILTAMLPSLIIVIGSTEDIHMLSSYFHGISGSNKFNRTFATRFTIKHIGIPLILTILTTALGFASNVFSNIGIIQEFAIISTIAILINGIITILLVPMVLHLTGPNRTSIYKGGEHVGIIPGFVVRLFSFTNSRFPRGALVLTMVLCIFFVYQASKLYVTNDPLSYFQKDQSIIHETRKIHRDLSGIKAFFITLESESDKAFLEPENIKKLVAIQKFLEKQKIFDRSISLADHLSLVNREFHGGHHEFFKIPDTRKLVAQYLLFFHRSDMESYVSHDFRRANIVIRHNVTDSNTLNKHINELKEVVSNVTQGQMKFHIVGENLMINAAAEKLMLAQTKSLVILLLVIFIIMSFMFTSIKGGIIALIPNLIPIILIFGIMGFLGIPLNPGTAMVAVIAIGIAIDATIHLLSRYNDLCRETSDYELAVNSTVKEMAAPMVATSLSLTLGFGVLLQSNFTVIAQFGALSAATMIFALFSNLIITPIIMSKTRIIGLYQILTVNMHKDILKKSLLFKGMTDYQIRKAILISELHKFKRGDILLDQGTFGRSMYIVLTGKVEIVRQSENGPKRVAVMDTGEIFGEISYIAETHRTADVRALTQVEVLRFDYQKLNKDLKFFPNIIAKLNFNISVILGKRLTDLMKRLDSRPEEKEK